MHSFKPYVWHPEHVKLLGNQICDLHKTWPMLFLMLEAKKRNKHEETAPGFWWRTRWGASWEDQFSDEERGSWIMNPCLELRRVGLAHRESFGPLCNPEKQDGDRTTVRSLLNDQTALQRASSTFLDLINLIHLQVFFHLFPTLHSPNFTEMLQVASNKDNDVQALWEGKVWRNATKAF